LRSKIECYVLSGLLILMPAISPGCGGRDRSVSREVIDGVEIVENGDGIYPGRGEPRALSLREEFRIDLEDELLAQAGLTEVRFLDVDSLGRIYLCQSPVDRGKVIFKFDERGKLLESFGAIGQGPGEVQNPRFMRMTSKDEIPVASMGSQKVVFFDTEGKVIRTASLPSVFFPLPRRGFLPLANGEYLITYIRVKPETLEFSEFGVGLFGPDFTKRLDLRTYPAPGEDDLKTFFSDFPLLAASQDSFFITTMASTREIEVYDLSGRLIRKILADYPTVDVPAGFREKILSPLRPDHPYWRNLAFPSTFPPFIALFTDDHGRLYAAGYGKDPLTGANVCDVFSPSGVRILRAALGYQVLQLGNPSVDAVIKNNRLYCVREKPSGFAEVLVFSLQWTVD
jgi:hypothetical protein